MASVVEGRVPPHDLDAEAAVLSAVMVDPGAFDKVNEFLRPDQFYSEAHRRIYEAAVDLSATGKPVDVVQVATWLRDHERLAQVGGCGLPDRGPQRRAGGGQRRRVCADDP